MLGCAGAATSLILQLGNAVWLSVGLRQGADIVCQGYVTDRTSSRSSLKACRARCIRLATCSLNRERWSRWSRDVFAARCCSSTNAGISVISCVILSTDSTSPGYVAEPSLGKPHVNVFLTDHVNEMTQPEYREGSRPSRRAPEAVHEC